MSILGHSSSGNPNVDDALSRIDERLSELYSLHGQMLTRGGIGTGTSTSSSLEGDGSNPAIADQSNKGIVIGTEGTRNTSGQLLWDNTFSPVRGALYRNLVPIAWAFTNNTTLVTSFNLTMSKGAAGEYTYTFIVAPPTVANSAGLAGSYAPLVSLTQSWALGANNILLVAATITDNTSFIVRTRNVTFIVGDETPNDVDLSHSVVVFAIH